MAIETWGRYKFVRYNPIDTAGQNGPLHQNS